MRRISIHLVTIWFLATLVVVSGIGSIVRGCERSDRSEAITRQQRERCILLGAENRDPATPDCDARPFFGRVRELLATPRYGAADIQRLFALAEQLKGSAPEALTATDPSRGWEPVRALAEDPFFTDVKAMLGRHPFGDILAGRAAPSESFVVESPLPFWQWRFWRGVYLIASIVFVLGFGLTAVLAEDKHPIIQYPWRRIDAMAMFLAGAPASVPAVTLYWVYRLVTSEWTRTWDAARTFLLTVGYQLRVVRKLPAPVVAPVEYLGIIAAPVRPATPQPAATETAGVQWYVMDRWSFLGVEHLLAAAGVGIYPITLRAPKELKGFAVAAEHLARFEEVLGPLAANPKDEDTDVERTVRRTYEPETGRVRVEKMESRENKDRMLLIARRVSALAGGIPLMVNSPDNAAQPHAADDDEVITLMHCATPLAAASRHGIRRLYGVDLSQPVDALDPDPDRGVIIRDPEGTPVAQVVGSTIYTLVYSMLSIGSVWSLETLARIINEAVAACLAQEPVDEESDDAKSSAWRDALDTQRDAYVNLCFRRFETKRRKLKEAVADCDRAVVEAGESIRKTLAKKKKKESELGAFLEKELPAERERLGNEFDQLAASPYVLSVDAGENGIDVYTKTIHIDWRGSRYRIGRFKVTLGDDGAIVIVNVANTAKGTRYEHPHVRDRRETCWGNMHAAVMGLMAERQYAVVITMIYRFLESYNPHNGVADVRHWKEENDA